MSVTTDKAAKMNVYDLLTKVVIIKPTKEKEVNARPRLEGTTGIDVGCTRALSQSYVEYGK